MLPSQKEMLERAPIGNIPHGVQLPLDLLEQHCCHKLVRWKDGEMYDIGPGVIWNMGSGADTGKVKQLKELGFLTIDTDINKQVVTFEQKRRQVSFVSDVEEFGNRMKLMSLFMLESMSAVWMGGLLENVGANWKKVLRSAHMSMLPNAWLIIGGVKRADQENDALRVELGPEKYAEYRRKWMHRYRTAHTFNPHRYPFGSFPVARPGELKYLEWLQTSDLDRLVRSSEYERDAQHINTEDVVVECQRMGMRIIVQRDEVWNARTPGDLYSGFTLLFQKDDMYRFDPNRRGMTTWQSTEWNINGGTDKLAHEMGPRAYYIHYRNQFIHNCAQEGVTPSVDMLAYLAQLIRGNGDDGEVDKTGWDWMMPDPQDM